MELYHGKTAAFKDMALSILPYLMTSACRKEGEKDKICILAATSGRYGKGSACRFCQRRGDGDNRILPSERRESGSGETDGISGRRQYSRYSYKRQYLTTPRQA